jgi:hypothetical protein
MIRALIHRSPRFRSDEPNPEPFDLSKKIIRGSGIISERPPSI